MSPTRVRFRCPRLAKVSLVVTPWWRWDIATLPSAFWRAIPGERAGASTAISQFPTPTCSIPTSPTTTGPFAWSSSRLEDQHTIPIAVETVSCPDRVTVGRQHQVCPRKSTYQQEQAGLGKMEVRQDRSGPLKLESRLDKQAGLARLSQQHAFHRSHAGGSHTHHAIRLTDRALAFRRHRETLRV